MIKYYKVCNEDGNIKGAVSIESPNPEDTIIENIPDRKLFEIDKKTYMAIQRKERLPVYITFRVKK